MQCSEDPAGIFETMAELSSEFNLSVNSEDTKNTSMLKSGDSRVTMRLSFSSETCVSTRDESNMKHEVPTLQGDSSAEVDEQSLTPTANTRLKSKNAIELKYSSAENDKTKQHCVHNCVNKENTALPSTAIAPDNPQEEDTCDQKSNQDCNITPGKQLNQKEDNEVVRRAQEEGRVNVIFPGTVTQEGCCRFVSEILKCILYQRQQLPMTYDQLVYSQKKQQALMQNKDTVSRRPMQSADTEWRKCQQTLQELEEVLQQLEVLFSLSQVPRVLLLMGGSIVFPKEMYEINMEDLALASGDQCLRVSSCLRQLFRTLFVADLLSDAKPVRLMPTTVFVLAHRNCGVGWFRPKLQFKVPTRVKNQIIVLSSDLHTRKEPRADESDWQDYVWFQTPTTIKGFSN